MDPPQAIPIFGKMEDMSVQVSHLWSAGGCNIWPDFNHGLGYNSNSGHILALGVYSSPTQIMAPLQVIPMLVEWKILLFRSYYLWSLDGCNSDDDRIFRRLISQMNSGN